ncbi:MAG: alanine racemase [Bryobacteraceae bacterium]
MRVCDLDTPAVLIDLDIMERNLSRAADYARAHGLRFRPHTKTHKIPELARKQLELGAAGLTVAKTGEAEVMLASGTPDLLVAFPILGRKKLDRLMAVADKTRVTVALDSVEAARELSEAAVGAGVNIGVLVEVDAGLGRVGVPAGPDLVQTIQGIEALPQLRCEGVAFFPGHIRKMDAEGLRALDALAAFVDRMLADLRRHGIEPAIVSGGSTPSLFHSHRIPGMNEIRPGVYIFNDGNTVAAGACSQADCAVSILTTVVSTAQPGQAVIDGGSKTFSTDRLASGTEAGFGYVIEEPAAVVARLWEEHGCLDVSRATRRFSIGDRIRIVPNHICTAMNLHDRVYGIRGGAVEEAWTVEGRGKLQ